MWNIPSVSLWTYARNSLLHILMPGPYICCSNLANCRFTLVLLIRLLPSWHERWIMLRIYEPSVNQRKVSLKGGKSSSSITVSSTVWGAVKKVIEIDLLFTETILQSLALLPVAAMWLSCQTTVAIDCWHTWHRIDTTCAWRGLSGKYTATMVVMVCLDPCPWSQLMAFLVSFTIQSHRASAQAHPKQALHVSSIIV